MHREGQRHTPNKACKQMRIRHEAPKNINKKEVKPAILFRYMETGNKQMLKSSPNRK
jgi:hypothetical protein